jgi:hypothetical protein
MSEPTESKPAAKKARKGRSKEEIQQERVSSFCKLKLRFQF